MLPAVGFGTYPHQGEDSAQTVEYAISIGYRLFDTALSYGNERGVGEGHPALRCATRSGNRHLQIAWSLSRLSRGANICRRVGEESRR